MAAQNPTLPSFKPHLLIALATAVIALSFVLYTKHAWEDYYITFRASKHLASGDGLVFSPGEKVHSFTSPLGVLLPALTSYLAGPDSDLTALWLFRLMSIAALSGAAIFVFAIVRRTTGNLIGAWLGTGFMMLEAKILDFSTNGMETGFLLLFTGWAIWATCTKSSKQWCHLGLAWAGIMWTRPDGFIYIGLLGAGFWLFNFFAAERQDRLATFILLVKAALLCTVLYLPWIVWATNYYGTPVPHTVTAKGSMSEGKTILGALKTFALLPINLWSGGTTAPGALMPTYYQAVAWPPLLTATAKVFGFVAMLAWLYPGLRPQVRAASLAFHGGNAYLTYFPYFPFPWYFPILGFLGVIVWGSILGKVFPQKGSRKIFRNFRIGLIFVIAGWLLVSEGFLTTKAAVQMETKQRLIYDGNLRRIGEWLADNAGPEDRVFLEPLGYIGYFSQLRTDDYPGLSCPRMVAARKITNSWSGLLSLLAPEWAVIRKSEAEQIERESPGFLRTIYKPVKHFNVLDQVNQADVTDRFMLAFDADFTVYHRQNESFDSDLLLGYYVRYGSNLPVDVIDSVCVRIVHAPGNLSVRVPEGAVRAEIYFGLLPGTYQEDPKTDGVTFEVIWAQGSDWRKVYSRTLDPMLNLDQRGIQSATITLPEGKHHPTRLILHTDQRVHPAKDWAGWGGITYYDANGNVLRVTPPFPY